MSDSLTAANPADVAAAIDETFKNSRAETLTESEKAFTLHMLAMIDAIIVVIRLVAFVVIIIIIAVAANTMSMTTRERIGEFSIFKTLGFGPFWIGEPHLRGIAYHQFHWLLLRNGPYLSGGKNL